MRWRTSKPLTVSPKKLAQHDRPSTIGIDTLYRSHGNISLEEKDLGYTPHACKVQEEYMDLIAHWNDLVRYYGERINQYEYLLAKASDTTYALLACKWVPEEGPIFGSYRGEHAEEQLINSPVWTQQIMSALGDWTELNRDPIIVTLALNRSPCGHCAMALTKALKHVQSAFSLRFEYHSFILASRGLYIGRGFMRDDKLDERTVTTDRSLDLLLDAGWKLCVLQFGDELPARGRELLQGLHRKNR